jgi:hypothetical protein
MFVVGKLNFLVFYEVLGSLRSGFETFLTYLSLAGIGGRDNPQNARNEDHFSLY